MEKAKRKKRKNQKKRRREVAKYPKVVIPLKNGIQSPFLWLLDPSASGRTGMTERSARIIEKEKPC